MSEIIQADFIDEHELALALARNALGMQVPVAQLLDQLGIQPAELLQLSRSDDFKRMVQTYRKELSDDGEGIRLKSAVALEASIKKLYTLIHNNETPANVVVQGVKQLADMAGVNKQEGAVTAPGSGFVVNIDLSGLSELTSLTPARKAVVVDVEPTKERNK